VRKIATHHLEDIRAKINGLTKLEGLLAKTVTLFRGNKAPDSPVLGILNAESTPDRHVHGPA
jgi:MerR family transcriptional regulator, mercuric resistance operon regulatory protein